MLPVALALTMGTALGLRGGIVSFAFFGIAICLTAASAFTLAGGVGLSGILALAAAILGYNLGLATGLAVTALRPAHTA